MYRVVFVENVLLYGQNVKKSKKVHVFSIFKSDPGDVFWIPIKNRTTGLIFLFFYSTCKFVLFNLLDGYLQKWTVFEL